MRARFGFVLLLRFFVWAIRRLTFFDYFEGKCNRGDTSVSSNSLCGSRIHTWATGTKADTFIHGSRIHPRIHGATSVSSNSYMGSKAMAVLDRAQPTRPLLSSDVAFVNHHL